MIPERCIKKVADSNIVIRDKKSRSAHFKNPERIPFKIIHFDGCVVFNKTAADYIIEKDSVGRIIVELKGSDIKKAVEQVAATIRYLKENNLTPLPKGCLIIGTSFPGGQASSQRYKITIKREFQIPCKIQALNKNLIFEDYLKFV